MTCSCHTKTSLYEYLSCMQLKRTIFSCVLVFDNFCCLTNLKIATNYLSQANSFLPLKAALLFFIMRSCYLLQASFGTHATPQWTGSVHEDIRKLQRVKKRFLFLSFSEMNQFTQEVWLSANCNGKNSDRDYCFLQQQSVTLSSHETVFSMLSAQYIDFYISQGDHVDPYPHAAHILTSHGFFFNPVVDLHKFSYFSLVVCLLAA